MPLLFDSENATGGSPPRKGGQPQEQPQGDDDVMAAVNGAMESDQFNDLGFGSEMASEEEQQKLSTIVESVVQVIHGNGSEKITKIIQGANEPYQGLGQAGHVLSLTAYMQANKQGLEPSPDIFLAENGVVQTTMELLWEVAESMGVVKRDDDEQFAAALLDVQRRIGETILEEEDQGAVQSAQELLLELETDEPVSDILHPASEQHTPPPEGGPMAGLDPRRQGGIPPEVMQRGGI